MGKGANTASLEFCSKSEVDIGRGITIPYYLTAHYSWAYMHPMAVKLFEPSSPLVPNRVQGIGGSG
jgi:hypothetical protein